MTHNVFVIGLDEVNREMLERLPGARDCRFHALLDLDDLRGVDEFPVDALLARVRSELDAFDGGVDAIVTCLDFPATEMVPILAREYGVPAPSLEALLRCTHKYWSRLVQAEVAADDVPAFAAFDPYDEASVAAIGLDFPFWIKPVGAYRSMLGFRIDDEAALDAAIATMRAKIGKLAMPLQQVLALAELPEGIAALPPSVCIAEQIITGRQCTLEGYVQDAEPVVYGVVDSIRARNRTSFSRYEYPSLLPRDVQERMVDTATRVVAATGLEHCAFNVECFYDRSRDRVLLLEVNTRISMSHCRLFELVDGTSHHQVMVDIGLGRNPAPPHREGQFRCAAKCFVRAWRDGTVTRVPSTEEIRRVEDAFPGASVAVGVDVGDRLSELADQDSYSYELATIWLGARNRSDLLRRYRACSDALGIEITADGHTWRA